MSNFLSLPYFPKIKTFALVNIHIFVIFPLQQMKLETVQEANMEPRERIYRYGKRGDADVDLRDIEKSRESCWIFCFVKGKMLKKDIWHNPEHPTACPVWNSNAMWKICFLRVEFYMWLLMSSCVTVGDVFFYYLLSTALITSCVSKMT